MVYTLFPLCNCHPRAGSSTALANISAMAGDTRSSRTAAEHVPCTTILPSICGVSLMQYCAVTCSLIPAKLVRYVYVHTKRATYCCLRVNNTSIVLFCYVSMNVKGNPHAKNSLFHCNYVSHGCLPNRFIKLTCKKYLYSQMSLFNEHCSQKMKASTLTTYAVPSTALSILLTLAQYIPCTPACCVN